MPHATLDSAGAPASKTRGPQSLCRFTEAYPASVGYGPAIQVALRANGNLLGYVRRIEVPAEPRERWMVYDTSGQEVGPTASRAAAANELHDAAAGLAIRTPAPGTRTPR